MVAISRIENRKMNFHLELVIHDAQKNQDNLIERDFLVARIRRGRRKLFFLPQIHTSTLL